MQAAPEAVTTSPTGYGPLENLPDVAPRCLTVLVASPLAEDHTFLQALFNHPNWRVHSAWTYQESEAILRESRVAVVICCESILPDGHSWKEVLYLTQTMIPPPSMIVADRLADNCLWAEVLSLGAYDLLMKPFDATEVFRAVSLAASQNRIGEAVV
jgi:DNA-binding response OmpR family regulator